MTNNNDLLPTSRAASERKTKIAPSDVVLSVAFTVVFFGLFYTARSFYNPNASVLVDSGVVTWRTNQPLTIKLPDGNGEVTGRGRRFARGESIREWLGIPYAAPPVGKNRWRPPQSLEAPNNKHDATKWGANCAQPGHWRSKPCTDGDCFPMPLAVMNGPFSEDCLFLNIWAPDTTTPEKGYPVMVFLHGGGYYEGGSHDTDLEGQNIVELRQDTLVVTLNYRLGALGFLGAEQLRLRDPEGGTGNYGLQDQRAALQWVQQNIAAFGGDPTKVMIFGQEAGAGAVSNHVVQSKSWGLFQRAAMESGGFQQWVSKNMEDAQANFEAFVNNTDCAKDTDEATVECLQDLDLDTVVHASHYMPMPQEDSWSARRWAPVIDGVDMLAHPMIHLAQGQIAYEDSTTGVPVPMLIGTSKDESDKFMEYDKVGEADPKPKLLMSSEDVRIWASKIWGVDVAKLMLDEGVNHTTPVYPTIDEKSEINFIQASRAVSDYMQTCPTKFFTRFLSSYQPKTFAYYFSEMPGENAVDNAANSDISHDAELSFMFYSPSLYKGFGIDQTKLAQTMVCYLANFAATGDPNVKGPFFNTAHSSCQQSMPIWHKYSALDEEMLEVKLPEPWMVKDARENKCLFWEQWEYKDWPWNRLPLSLEWGQPSVLDGFLLDQDRQANRETEPESELNAQKKKRTDTQTASLPPPPPPPPALGRSLTDQPQSSLSLIVPETEMSAKALKASDAVTAVNDQELKEAHIGIHPMEDRSGMRDTDTVHKALGVPSEGMIRKNGFTRMDGFTRMANGMRDVDMLHDKVKVQAHKKYMDRRKLAKLAGDRQQGKAPKHSLFKSLLLWFRFR